jgi:glycosyltransferase involved in cell wall biosynthesis
MRKKKLLIIHPALAPYRIDLFNALDDAFELVIVFLEKDVLYQSYDQDELRSRLRARHLFLDSSWHVLGRRIPRGIWSLIHTHEPDVIVSHEFSPTSAAIALGRTRYEYGHVIWTADNRQVIDEESWFRSIARRVLLRWVQAVIVYSEEMRELYLRRFRFDGSIGICPNLQSERALLAAFGDSRDAANGLIERLALAGKKVVLTVGRLAKVKGQDKLLDVFAIALRDDHDLVLVLVGDGPERARLERYAADLGIDRNVVFAGHREGVELYAWYTLGSVFVLLSEYEPWGAVVNEALVAGMPVVCSSHVGARVLIEEGRNGSVIDTEDVESIADKVLAWAESGTPLSNAFLTRGRESLMGGEFDAAVQGFVETVQSITRA